ncbi:MAG: efflux RND transporter permease subunit, partial [Gammaproteobacteria bacterium]|nr:efflux RND transporter permease subunit [Gammaproteobacteria bacterium]
RLPFVRELLPEGASLAVTGDQSVFVKAAIQGVATEGIIAAALTALMILLFLGNWRLTVMILAAIPLSIIAAVLVMAAGGQTLNTMTLGGFALAVGILVDNGTVVIENIERNIALRAHLAEAIVHGCGEVGTPTFLSTLCICIVFVPVFLLQGTARYLFSPLSVSVIVSLLASLALSFTMVPVLFFYLMRAHAHPADPVAAGSGPGAAAPAGAAAQPAAHPLRRIHLAFESGFRRLREGYREALAWALSQPKPIVLAFVGIIVVSLPLFPFLGRDFFPDVDAGQMRLHVRAPAGTRLETTQQYFSRVEATIRQLIGNGQISVILDNIGLPYSGINIALSDSATVGPMDGEILVALQKQHAPTAELTAMLRRELPASFPALQFFFQPADIVDQVLNFGQPAPIDIRVSAADTDSAYRLAARLSRLIAPIPGVVDAHVFQVPNAPALSVDVDRALATQVGLTQREAASNVLVTTNSSAQTAPNFWVDPGNGVSYPLVVQQPTYDIASSQDLKTMPVSSAAGASQSQLLMNMSSIGRLTAPLVTSQLNIRPVFDVHANVQDRDLYSTAGDIERVIRANRPPQEKAISVTLSGQVATMRESYTGLFTGIALAVVLVYLFLVINFQSCIDPLIVLMAVPFTLSGIIWVLYLTQTHLSAPALMGTLMSIGLTTANSILVVTFANQRMAAGDGPLVAALTAGYTRLRPVLMTAGAMVLGMVPMAIGIGEGGEQNAPLARAVIGGLLFATFATLVFVPTMYRLLRRAPTRVAFESAG